MIVSETRFYCERARTHRAHKCVHLVAQRRNYCKAYHYSRNSYVPTRSFLLCLLLSFFHRIANASEMVCPTGCTCLANTFTFNAYNDGVTDSTAPHVLYASATQRLTVTDPSWPAEGAALQAQINGPPQSLYVKVLPISLAGGCCTGAVSDATHAGPTYGGAATAGSSGPAGIMLSLPTNTYKICVASGRSTPPFSDTDYLMSANTVLTVFSNQPPPPPLPPPSPLPPIMPPPSLPPRAPPTPPPPPPFPLFSALTAEGSGLDECAFAPPPGSALPPPPALPPQHKAPPQMPPEPFTPGPLYPPSPSAPPEPPPFCVTGLGGLVLVSLPPLVLLCAYAENARAVAAVRSANLDA